MPKYAVEGVLFGLLLLTGKWATACLLLGVCAWDLRTYLRGEHKVPLRARPVCCSPRSQLSALLVLGGLRWWA